MAEDVVQDPVPAEPAADPAPAPAADPAPASDAPSDPSANALSDTPTSDPAPVEAAWPDNWASMMSGENEALAKLVGRYNEPQAIAKALFNANEKIRSGELVKPLSDNPSEDELKTYREKNGIPIEAKDYQVEWRQGLEPQDDADKAIVEGFLEAAHARNMAPENVQSVVDWYQDTIELNAQNMAAQADQAHQKTEDQLAIDWGEAKQANLDLTKNWLDEKLKGYNSSLDEFRTLRLEDGTFLGDYLPLIKVMADQAKFEMGTDDFAVLSGVQGGQGIDAQIDELMALRTSTNPAEREKYMSQEIQDKISQLFAAKERREAAATTQ